jgi:purine nucleosidase/pyrimidine-specific ribonucleoside hydrolase
MMKVAILFLLMVGMVSGQTVPIIFDTDIGDDVDDALALALALQSPELDVKAVTTVMDATEMRSRLAWKELCIFGRRDIPVGTGTDEPLLDPVRVRRHAQFDAVTSEDVIPGPPRRAVDLIIRTLLDSPRKITIVAVGALTNVALALKTEPRIKDKIERIVLMGGAYFMAQPEYNIYRDRIASEIVFRSGVPITGVGLDVTMRCKLKPEDIERIRAAGHPTTDFLVRSIELWREFPGNSLPTLHDPLAVAVAMIPSLVETQLGRVQVETASPMLYGFTLFTPADRLPKDGPVPNTAVARNVDAQQFLKLFMERVTAAPRSAGSVGRPGRP